MAFHHVPLLVLALCAAASAASLGLSIGRGLLQSPIDIPVYEAVERTDLPPLNYKHYASTQNRFSISNSGHGAQITLKNALYQPQVKGGPLGDSTYVLEQAHFHWGHKDGVGSEHRLGGKPFSMEVHLVHYNNDYGSYEEASKHDDGLAVVAFFIEAYSSIKNSAFQHVVDLLPKIPLPSEKTTAHTDLFGWLEQLLRPTGYYTYAGSLTTKPYSENVRWIIYDEAIPIGRQQIAAFRNLFSTHSTHLDTNYRTVQPLNDRVVEHVPE